MAGDDRALWVRLLLAGFSGALGLALFVGVGSQLVGLVPFVSASAAEHMVDHPPIAWAVVTGVLMAVAFELGRLERK